MYLLPYIVPISTRQTYQKLYASFAAKQTTNCTDDLYFNSPVKFKGYCKLICFYNNELTLNLTEYEANGVIDNSGDEDVDPDSWEQVGPKKKSVLTRKVTF